MARLYVSPTLETASEGAVFRLAVNPETGGARILEPGSDPAPGEVSARTRYTRSVAERMLRRHREGLAERLASAEVREAREALARRR